MTSPTDDPARHITAPRLAALRILTAAGPIDEAGIRDAWRASRPGMSPRHVGALPRMIRHLLWRLEILGWITEGEHGWEPTDLGRSVLESRSRSTEPD
ncbi:hypothetical protein [Agromyces sp. H66]|uniref:hypothetical protein n=1 Tax=Agromyces sp. H66 TaxID=2529859 RepID=UPI0010A9D0FA|nr:hypothetical protein [Agromyces sp. H66]